MPFFLLLLYAFFLQTIIGSRLNRQMNRYVVVALFFLNVRRLRNRRQDLTKTKKFARERREHCSTQNEPPRERKKGYRAPVCVCVFHYSPIVSCAAPLRKFSSERRHCVCLKLPNPAPKRKTHPKNCSNRGELVRIHQCVCVCVHFETGRERERAEIRECAKLRERNREKERAHTRGVKKKDEESAYVQRNVFLSESERHRSNLEREIRQQTKKNRKNPEVPQPPFMSKTQPLSCGDRG